MDLRWDGALMRHWFTITLLVFLVFVAHLASAQTPIHQWTFEGGGFQA